MALTTTLRPRARRRPRGVVGSLIDDAGDLLQSVAAELTPAVVAAVDVQSVVQQVDLNALLARTDLNAVLGEVDVNALVERVDIDRLLDRLDVNDLLSRVDMDALVGRTEMGSIITAAGAGVASRVIDVARSQGVGLDLLIQGWADRIFGRRSTVRPGSPGSRHEGGVAVP